MFSSVYDSYNRSYRKVPDLIDDIGGVLNTLMFIATIINSFIEKKLKEAEIFNICRSDSIDSPKLQSKSIKFSNKPKHIEKSK
jgi:hypothetical protein